MKSFFFLLVIGFSFIKAQAQEDKFLKPDFTSIENQIKDKESLFYYPELYKRYQAGDTTLTMREYRLLYYGFFFQEQYSVFNNRDSAETVQTILEKETPTKQDWYTLIRVEKKYLDKAPFDMRDLHLVYIAYMELKDSATAGIYHDKILKIARTIMSTGDGKSEASAFYVISVAHEYDLISILGFEHTGDQKLTASRCDYIGLQANDYKVDGLYFDVKQLFREYAKLISD